ncbi:MAG: SGNH/GDSL hydrolase family protein [Candidatus Kapaibacteriales bacterium]
MKYIYGFYLSILLYPYLYIKGERIKKSVPKLAEAAGKKGIYKAGSKEVTTKSILLVGESTIAGVGVNTHEEGLAGTIAKTLSIKYDINIKWKVHAKSSYTVNEIRRNILPTLNEERIDVFIIGVGGNDALQLNNPKKWDREIRVLIDMIVKKHPTSAILFCALPPIKEILAFPLLIRLVVGSLIDIYRDVLQKISTEYKNVYFCSDMITIVKWRLKYELDIKYEEFFSDGIHPSKLSYQLWARDIVTDIVGFDILKTTFTKQSYLSM